MRGLWTDEKDLWALSRDTWENSDLLAGHFTLNHLRTWAKQNRIDLHTIKLVSVIRDPVDQVYSNLNFPYELQARQAPITEEWMQRMVAGLPGSADHIVSILKSYPWLLNMQTTYLRSDNPLVEIESFDLVGIFPDVQWLHLFTYAALGIEHVSILPHENASQKFLDRSLFDFGPVREFLNAYNQLDNYLYSRVFTARQRRY